MALASTFPSLCLYAARLTGSYHQMDMGGPGRGQKGKHIGLAVLHYHRLYPLRQRLFHPLQSLEPFSTFLFRYLALTPLGSSAELLGLARPQLLS
jgi:hypothetical protein